MANPKSLQRPPAGERYDPTAIDATGATLGQALIAVSDGSGGQRAGYGTVSGGGGSGASTIVNTDALAIALQFDADSRIRDASLTSTPTSSSGASQSDAIAAALAAESTARILAGTSTPSALDEYQVQLIAQFYGA